MTWNFLPVYSCRHYRAQAMFVQLVLAPLGTVSPLKTHNSPSKRRVHAAPMHRAGHYLVQHRSRCPPDDAAVAAECLWDTSRARNGMRAHDPTQTVTRRGHDLAEACITALGRRCIGGRAGDGSSAGCLVERKVYRGRDRLIATGL